MFGDNGHTLYLKSSLLVLGLGVCLLVWFLSLSFPSYLSLSFPPFPSLYLPTLHLSIPSPPSLPRLFLLSPSLVCLSLPSIPFLSLPTLSSLSLSILPVFLALSPPLSLTLALLSLLSLPLLYLFLSLLSLPLFYLFLALLSLPLSFSCFLSLFISVLLPFFSSSLSQISI